jgi:hypothetical protein
MPEDESKYERYLEEICLRLSETIPALLTEINKKLEAILRELGAIESHTRPR